MLASSRKFINTAIASSRRGAATPIASLTKKNLFHFASATNNAISQSASNDFARNSAKAFSALLKTQSQQPLLFRKFHHCSHRCEEEKQEQEQHTAGPRVKSKAELQFEERRRHRDQLINAMTEDGRLRVAILNNTASLNEAQRRFNMSAPALTFLGRAMSGAALLNSFLKGEERIIIEMRGGGPIQGVVVESIRVGEMRGYVVNPTVQLQPGQELGDLILPGTITVKRILYDMPRPVTSTVALVKGDVESDLKSYFDRSEQIPTALILDTIFDETTNKALYSYGVLLQALPETPAEVVQQAQEKLDLLKQKRDEIAELMRNSVKHIEEGTKGKSLIELLTSHVPPLKNTTTRKTLLDFFCRCSEEGFMESLAGLGVQALNDIAPPKPAAAAHDVVQENPAIDVPAFAVEPELTLTCDFCNNKYELNREKMDKVRQRAVQIEEERSKQQQQQQQQQQQKQQQQQQQQSEGNRQ